MDTLERGIHKAFSTKQESGFLPMILWLRLESFFNFYFCAMAYRLSRSDGGVVECTLEATKTFSEAINGFRETRVRIPSFASYLTLSLILSFCNRERSVTRGVIAHQENSLDDGGEMES